MKIQIGHWQLVAQRRPKSINKTAMNIVSFGAGVAAWGVYL
jgi:hypothetical protein